MKRVCLILLLIVICTPKAFAFTDVTSQDNGEAINYLFNEDIVSGYTDGTYRPRSSINRVELMKILVESRGLSATGSNCFKDVSNEWFAKYVCTAKNKGWVKGYDDGTFKPSKNINRAEAIAMMFKVYKDKIDIYNLGKGESELYLDVSTTAWYVNYLYAGQASGILARKSNFYPSMDITRGDVASALYRLLGYLKPKKTVAVVVPVPTTTTTTVEPAPVVIPEPVVVSEPVVTPEPVVTAIPTTTTTTTTVVTTSNPFSGASLYVDPYSKAKSVAGMEKISSQPTARWFGDWSGDIKAAADKYVTTVGAAGALPVMVIYNIPGRDCGSYSAGGSNGGDAYKTWIQNFADGVGSRKAIVVLEPDALPLDCLYSNSTSLMSSAVDILKSKADIHVYLDAGHPNWTSSTEMARRLTLANVAKADGFALNVSNFYLTSENIEFGKKISALVGGKHFIIDTSRNGTGWNGEWCNPSGMSLGQNPTTNTGEALADAYLWVKPPGESDGTCNGGPSAGSWWADYAWGLMQ